MDEDRITRSLRQVLAETAPQAAGYALSPSATSINVEHGIWSAITSVLKSPVFHKLTSSVIDVALTQRGLSPANFPSTSFGGFIYHPTIGNDHVAHSLYTSQMGLRSRLAGTLEDPNARRAIAAAVDGALTQHGIKPGDSAEIIQQGLASGFLSIIGHPTVRNSLIGVVDEILGQRGLNPATAAQYPEIQQGVWTGLLDVIKGPAFQKIVSGVVDSTLTQRGIKSAPSPTGYGIFTDISKLLTHPVITTTLTDLVNTTLKGHGLNPHDTAMYNPEIQQGIWNNIVDVLKHPMFQKVIGTVVSSTMQQHGLNPSGKAGESGSAPLPAEVQQGIWSAIGSVFEHPMFKKAVEGAINVAVSAAGSMQAPIPNMVLDAGDTVPAQQHDIAKSNNSAPISTASGVSVVDTTNIPAHALQPTHTTDSEYRRDLDDMPTLAALLEEQSIKSDPNKPTDVPFQICLRPPPKF